MLPLRGIRRSTSRWALPISGSKPGSARSVGSSTPVTCQARTDPPLKWGWQLNTCRLPVESAALLPVREFRKQPPEFWALVKLVSHKLKYSERGTKRVKRYTADDA